LGRQSLNFADDEVAHNATVACHAPCHYSSPAGRLRRGMLSTAQHRESATTSEQQGVSGGGQDKRPHIAARNGCLFTMTSKPIPQCAPLSVNVREGRKGRALIGNSMG
jgi:hypothetical protein